MFPLADARGRIVGFQARKLHDDDPLRGKYVNSPEGELFHKSAILYGLDLARTAIAKQERAVVVEGNTDVIALRQAGFEPVVASMGTALTERQLKELQRLTRRLYLCFDSDAAGEDATLRGMELASTLGFDVRVVALPKGQDPADAPAGFEQRLSGASSYVVHRVRLELERTPDRQEAFVRAREVLAKVEDSPERQDALRLLADTLDLPRETLAGLGARSAAGRGAVAVAELSPAMLEKGEQLERRVLAACVHEPALVSAPRGAARRSLRLGAAPPLPDSSRRGRGGGRRARGVARRARRPSSARGARRAHRQGAAAQPACAPAPARARRRGARAGAGVAGGVGEAGGGRTGD